MNEIVDTKINKVFGVLRKIEGLDNFRVLSKEDVESIFELEEENNLAVFECLNRDVCLLLTHDENFREPFLPLSIIENKEEIFIPQPFPEVEEMDVVSSSPNLKVHEFLKMKFNLNLEEKDASLLVGFNL